MLQRLRNLIISAGVILALLPSLTIGFKFLHIPPEIESLFAFVVGLVGLLVFFFVFAARQRFLKMKMPMLCGLFMGAAVVGLALALWLSEIVTQSVHGLAIDTPAGPTTVPYIEPPQSDYNSTLRQIIVDKYRGRVEVAVRSEPELVLDEMNRSAGPVRMKMLILLSLAHGLMLFGLLLGGLAAVRSLGRENDTPLSS